MGSFQTINVSFFTKKIKERPIFTRFSFMGRKRSSHEEKILQFFLVLKGTQMNTFVEKSFG